MTTKRMKSNEVRVDWADVLRYVQAGGTVVVEHYNRPVARIVPIEESTMTMTASREAVLAWLGDRHGLTEEGISTLVDRAAEIGRDWPSSERVHVQRRMDSLWWAYQDIVTAAASSQQEALNIIHAKTRTGVDPWAAEVEPAATETATYTRTDEQGTETIAITRTGDEVREVYTVDGAVVDDAIVAGPGSRDADTYLHDRDIDLRADGWTTA